MSHGNNGEGYLIYPHGGAKFLTLMKDDSIKIWEGKNSDGPNDLQIFKMTERG